MKTDYNVHDAADDWQEFAETQDALYRHLYILQYEMMVMSEEAWHGTEGKALAIKLMCTAAQVMSREAYTENCRRKGEAVPTLKRPQGTA